MGLNVIVHLLQELRLLKGRGSLETTKIAIHRKRIVALLRGLIHVIPVAAALYEIVLNWNTYYVGVIAYNQALYQFLAKAHELTIQASLTAIVFSVVRFAVTRGDGLPFGLLFSGLQITQISFLWSMELWGSACSRKLPFYRKIGFLGIICLCAVLATTSGPSSAVLLIPRLDFWPAGSAHIWINATSEDLWPER